MKAGLAAATAGLVFSLPLLLSSEVRECGGCKCVDWWGVGVGVGVGVGGCEEALQGEGRGVIFVFPFLNSKHVSSKLMF